jgi:hypothetical protein
MLDQRGIGLELLQTNCQQKSPAKRLSHSNGPSRIEASKCTLDIHRKLRIDRRLDAYQMQALQFLPRERIQSTTDPEDRTDAIPAHLSGLYVSDASGLHE